MTAQIKSNSLAGLNPQKIINKSKFQFYNFPVFLQGLVVLCQKVFLRKSKTLSILHNFTVMMYLIFGSAFKAVPSGTQLCTTKLIGLMYHIGRDNTTISIFVKGSSGCIKRRTLGSLFDAFVGFCLKQGRTLKFFDIYPHSFTVQLICINENSCS